MSSDLDCGEPLYRACSEPSLPTIGPGRHVTAMHAELIEKIAESSMKHIVKSRHCNITPKSSRPTTSVSHSESPSYRRHRSVRARGLVTDVQVCDASTSSPKRTSHKSHRTRKRHDKHDFSDRAHSESPSSGNVSPRTDDTRDIHLSSLRRTESRLDLKCPNKFPRPRSILKQAERGARARDSSASPVRMLNRTSQEKYVRSAGANYGRDMDRNRSTSPISIISDRASTTRGRSQMAGQRVSYTNKRTPDRLSPSTLLDDFYHSPGQRDRGDRSPLRSSPHTYTRSLDKPGSVKSEQGSGRNTSRSGSPSTGLTVRTLQSVQSSRLGVDIVVLAFGEPGTGKTYTLTGLNGSYAERGLIPRALDEVVGKRRTKGYDLKTSISYVEFSENICYDLLAPGKKPVAVNPAKIKPIEVPSSIEALDLLFRGEVRRKFEKVHLNCGTSVYTIHIQSQALNALDPYTSFSKIHFVDAPGIETLWNSEKSDPCAISANLDKLSVDVTSRWAYYLSKAIAKPSKTKNMAVYGTSGLISYLERSFTHGFVTLLGMIRPEGDDLRKTLSTLRFGCKVARLHTGLLERHQQSSAAQRTAVLKNEIDELKAQIETSKLISLGEYDRFNVCQGEAQHIERLIKMYIKSNFPNSVSETCLLSTAKPDLLLEEIRRQFQAENYFITSHFHKKSVQVYGRTQSSSIASDSRMKSSSRKRKGRGSRDNISQLFDANQFKDIAEQATKEEDKDKERSSTNTGKGGGPRKSKSPGSRKSVASRKSMGPRKSKAGGGVKTPKAPKSKSKKASATKPEPALAPIDKAFLERGRKDRVWLMNEFLLRNKDVADEKDANESFFEMARDAKISKAKDLDEYRASLGRTRIWLNHLQSKRNQMDVGPLGEPGAQTEEEKTFLDKEKETREKIVKTVDELVTLHAMLSDARNINKTFQEKLQARFKAWIDEIYVDERYEGEEEYMMASQLDKEIPRQSVTPSIQLETKPEVDFLKLQESFFHKKLPIMPIIYE